MVSIEHKLAVELEIPVDQIHAYLVVRYSSKLSSGPNETEWKKLYRKYSDVLMDG